MNLQDYCHNSTTEKMRKRHNVCALANETVQDAMYHSAKMLQIARGKLGIRMQTWFFPTVVYGQAQAV